MFTKLVILSKLGSWQYFGIPDSIIVKKRFKSLSLDVASLTLSHVVEGNELNANTDNPLAPSSSITSSGVDKLV